MKITVGGETYSALKLLSFAPQTDMTGSTVAINEFEVDIMTADDISIGQYAYLYDDLDNLWAKYWVVYAEHVDKYTTHVKAQSTLALLERLNLSPVMYNGYSVQSAIADIFFALGADSYVLDSSFDSLTLTGFCPEQDAKTRLQWICFTICAYVKSYFGDKIEILPADSQSETLIPIDKTFWKPVVTYKEYVTALNIKGYSFTQGTPSATDQWVTDGTNYYIMTERTFTLTNPDAPAAAPAQEITVDGITLINSSNVSGVLSYLSSYYFKRQEAQVDVVNNAEYLPGQRVIAYTDEEALAVGFINSAEFTFGVQARSRLSITPIDVKEAARITLLYMYGNLQIGSETYYLPVGYSYSIELPYIDIKVSEHRYIFRPTIQSVSGTVPDGGDTVEVEYAVALDFYPADGGRILYIESVDDIEQDQSETERVEIE